MSRIRRVVLLVIDGLRPDAVSPALMPSLATLAASGWSSEGRTVRPSITVAALSSLATGVLPERHGLVEARLPSLQQLSGLRPLPLVLKRHGHRTRVVAGPLPPAHRVLGRMLLGLAGVDSLVCSPPHPRELALAAEREQCRREAALTIVYANNCDQVGHRQGWMSPAYLDAARAADEAVGILADGILGDESALLLVTADHGGGGVVATDHDLPHPANDTIPIVAVGVRVLAGRGHGSASLLDVPPTILRALGAPIPREYAGRALHVLAEDAAAVA
jgi:predicted AlkP superfamily pyrophosphatase or phosphodiesterase